MTSPQRATICASCTAGPPSPLTSSDSKWATDSPNSSSGSYPPSSRGTDAFFEQALSEFRTYYSAHKQDRTAPYSGIMEMLDALLDAGVTLGVLSNKDHAATTPLVAQYFGDRFAVAQGRVDAFPPKPAAPITLHVLELLSADPASTLYVGDSNVDIACGHNAGLRSCGVAWGFRGRAELEAAGADYVIDDPRELIDIVL